MKDIYIYRLAYQSMTCQPNATVKHKHHIVPRYKGGSDDPSNLVEVSVTQHAMWHFCNYQLWGNWEDHLAYRALSGHIGKEEINYYKSKRASEKGVRILREKFKDGDYKNMHIEKLKSRMKNPKYRKKITEHCRKIHHLAVEAARTPEARKNQIEAMRRNNHQKGEKNSQYGKRWIHNLELEVSKRIGKNEDLPEGWREGRIINFDDSTRKKCNWFHPLHGTSLNLTVLELIEKFPKQKLRKDCLYLLIRGVNKSHMGWTMVD